MKKILVQLPLNPFLHDTVNIWNTQVLGTISITKANSKKKIKQYYKFFPIRLYSRIASNFILFFTKWFTENARSFFNISEATQKICID